MNDAYQAQLLLCDQQIAQVLFKLSQEKLRPSEPLPKPHHKTRQPNVLNFDVRTLLYQLVGVDLTQIHGIGPFFGTATGRRMRYRSERTVYLSSFHFVADARAGM